MKNIFLTILFVIFACFAYLSQAKAQTTQFGEQILNFNSVIEVSESGVIKVKETIVYDFGNQSRHGIYRTIPTVKTNKDGKEFQVEYGVHSVKDESGKDYTYSETRENGELKIKIGDANKTVTGVHTYILDYEARGELLYFSTLDELYWNVTGNDWQVPINDAKASVILPKNVNEGDLVFRCFRGPKGSQDQCQVRVSGYVVSLSTSTLRPSEGMTAVVRFPKGIVQVLNPTEIVDFSDTLIGKLVYLGIGFGILFWYVLLPLCLPFKWWREGRDPSASSGLGPSASSGAIPSGVVRAWFSPPKKDGRDLTPAEAGTLVDERVDLREIASMIIHLAQRGYIKIKENKKNDFELIKLDYDSKKGELLDFEDKFLTGLFKDKTNVRLKDKKLYMLTTSIEKMIYSRVVKDGFFPKNPEEVRKKYAILTGLAIISFNFILALVSSLFGRIMPRKTLSGVHAANTAKSLKNFLTSQERQFEFQADKQMMFEKLLPYAVAFGVEKIWAKRFENLSLKDVDWYQGSSSDGFTASYLASSIHSSFANSLQSSIAAPTTSSTGFSSGSSGGSSGGGGGGGGGGSW